jgi:tryptophan-rich sensory protein
MNKIILTIIFLIINFGGLALGGWLMNSGPTSDWYMNLNKAPWTPPGWVFGVAWTIIMICFSIYLTELFSFKINTKIVLLFTIQIFLNVIWNYVFFNQHLIGLGLLTIVLLTILIFYFFFIFNENRMQFFRYLLIPYMLWLCVATSLNAYILIKN